MENTEAFAMETAALDEAVKSGNPVRLFFCTGYQAEVTVVSYDLEIIVCRKLNHDKLWIVQRRNVCTIEV